MLESEKISPIKNRVSGEELKQMFIDIDAPLEIQVYFINLHKALEATELELNELQIKYNSIKEVSDRRIEQIDILKEQLGEGFTKGFLKKELSELQKQYTELLRRYEHERSLTTKYVELGKAEDRYNKALESYYSDKINEGVNASDISHKRLTKAFKIAAYGKVD